MADAEKLFGDADVVGAEKFVVTEGVIDRVVEDPDVGDFRGRSVGGNRFELLAQVLNGFGEVLAIVFVDFDAGRRDGTDFVGEVVGGAVGEDWERGEEDEGAEVHGEQDEESGRVGQRKVSSNG